MSFSDDIDKFARKTSRNATTIFKKVTFDMYGNLPRRTPKDTGRAQGNWQIGINNIPRGTLSLEGIGIVGGGQLLSATEQVKLGDRVYIVNNLPYIKKLEDGSSTQAPNGMVKLEVARFKNTVNKAVRLIK